MPLLDDLWQMHKAQQTDIKENSKPIAAADMGKPAAIAATATTTPSKALTTNMIECKNTNLKKWQD